MTQVKSAQDRTKKLALRKRATPHSLAERRRALVVVSGPAAAPVVEVRSLK